MAIPEEIDPKVPMRVMDLVRDAGIDVSDWGNYAKGADQAASNPRYCYEWAFVEPGKVVALNLWYDKLVEHEGFIEQHLNLLADARKEPKGARAKRRRTMLGAIEVAFRDKPRRSVAWRRIWVYAGVFLGMGCKATPKEQTRFGCFDYSFISFILPPMMLFDASRRLP